MHRLSLTRRLLVAAAVLAGLAGPVQAADGDVVVFAAASLKTALDEIGAKWTAETGTGVVASYGGSSALAKQIRQGAPADVFISASVEWMDDLASAGLIDLASRRDLLGNSLVLVAHGTNAAPVDIVRGFDLAGLLGDGRLAMAFVDSVPAGVYGKAALKALGVWEAVEPKVAQSDNVRAALALVATGEAPYGIVYRTDANAENGVSVVGTFPEGSHESIVYPAARIAASSNAQAQAFLDYLASDKAKAVFEAQGFTVIAK